MVRGLLLLLSCGLTVSISHARADEITDAIRKAYPTLDEQNKNFEEQAKEILEENPKNVNALYDLASICLSRGNFVEGKTLAFRGSKIAPTDKRFPTLILSLINEEYNVLLNRAHLEYLLQNYDSALQFALEAKAVKNSVEVNVTLFEIYSGLSQDVEVAKLLKAEPELVKYLEHVNELRRCQDTQILAK